MDWKDYLKYICFIVIVIFVGFLGVFINSRTCIDDYIEDMLMGEKNVQEGEFTIINKNIEYGPFWTKEKSFTLESDTKERYIVYVTNTIYQSYFVNDKIKATFDTYSKRDTCSNFKVEGLVANE